MESTLSLTTTMALLSLTKTLNSSSTPMVFNLHRHFSTPRPSHLLHHPLSRILVNHSCRRPNRSCHFYLPSILGAVERVRSRLECVSNSAASFSSGGGGFGGKDGNSGGNGDGGRGGGDSAAEGGKVTPNAVAGGADDASVLFSDVIILDVGGMSCGGCAASVKRILESQPQVSSASVNLTTETAIAWPVHEAKVVPNWHTQLGEALAQHLTTCGFKSNLRGQGAIGGDVSL